MESIDFPAFLVVLFPRLTKLDAVIAPSQVLSDPAHFTGRLSRSIGQPPQHFGLQIMERSTESFVIFAIGTARQQRANRARGGYLCRGCGNVRQPCLDCVRW
jgi:hypothetical protein